MPSRAMSRPYNTLLLSKSAVCGLLRYFGCASPNARPPNAIVSPLALRIGKINPEIAAVNLYELATSLKLSGRDEDEAGTMECPFELGEETAPQEEAAGTPAYEVIAEDVRDCEVACTEIQHLCSAMYRKIAKRPDGELLPLKSEPIDEAATSFKSYFEFDEFVEREHELYLQSREVKLAALAAALAGTEDSETLDETFDIEE